MWADLSGGGRTSWFFQGLKGTAVEFSAGGQEFVVIDVILRHVHSEVVQHCLNLGFFDAQGAHGLQGRRELGGRDETDVLVVQNFENGGHVSDAVTPAQALLNPSASSSASSVLRAT